MRQGLVCVGGEPQNEFEENFPGSSTISAFDIATFLARAAEDLGRTKRLVDLATRPAAFGGVRFVHVFKDFSLSVWR